MKGKWSQNTSFFINFQSTKIDKIRYFENEIKESQLNFNDQKQPKMTIFWSTKIIKSRLRMVIKSSFSRKIEISITFKIQQIMRKLLVIFKLIEIFQLMLKNKNYHFEFFQLMLKNALKLIILSSK